MLESEIQKRFKTFHIDIADRRGIEYVDKPDFYDVIIALKHWIMTLRLIALKKPDIVYLAISQNTMAFLRDSLFMIIAFLWRTKVVIHLRGANLLNWYNQQPKFLQLYAKTIIGKVAGGIVLGKSIKYNFEKFLDPANIFVIPNGIEVHERNISPKDKRQAVSRLLPKYRVIHLSTLIYKKGALAFIEAIPKVVSKRQNVEFILAGPWVNRRDERRAFDFIKKNDLDKYVTFSGTIYNEEKFALLRSCDLFVFPGIQQEGQPRVVIEAMAAGLPVLFTNRGCLRETVVEGETGMEIKINDPEDLADKILWMLDNPNEMKRMGSSGRERYKRLYTLENHTQKMLNVFSTIAGNK
jgi:glycosyltransferase involved in cell wall biosynthesis